MYKFYFFALIMMITNLASSQNILEELLEKNKAALTPVMDTPQDFEVQIIYTQIDRDKNNIPHFETYGYNLHDNYFYPASTIKMPVAFAALEKLNQLKIKGLDKFSTLKNGVGSVPQTPAEIDSTAENGLPSIAHYIKKIFLVSDNDANNRLYEFIGQKELNDILHDKGLQRTRIIHRLGGGGASFNYETNQLTNPVSFYNGDELLYYQGEVQSKATWDFDVKNTSKGKGYMSNGKLINTPFDFSQKNYLALMDLHLIMQSVIFPEGIPEYCQFDLTPEDYKFLYHWMSARPRGAKYPYYNEPDGYVKFFLYGGKEETIPDHIKIFNKVGYAYGYLTDIAYIIDTKNKIEFQLSATIHVNANQTYNDNVYEYDTIGLPFLKEVGEIIYQHELKRPRAVEPDLRKYLGN